MAGRIWFKDYTIKQVEQLNVRMSKFLGMKFTEITDTTLSATLPVDERTTQPLALLHGGATCVLAETVGSIASNLILDPSAEYAVGMNLYSQYLKSVTHGVVTGTATALHVGKSSHVWRIDITHPDKGLIAISNLTTAVRPRR
jgi:1,4-dihydroxy-2-naphthoyl-CoA hydrolase